MVVTMSRFENFTHLLETLVCVSALLLLPSCSSEPDDAELEQCDIEDCDGDLRAAVVQNGNVAAGAYAHYSFAKVANYRYTVCINVSLGNADLYGHYTGYPTTVSYQFRSMNAGTEDDCFSFNSTSAGTYYVSIHGNGAASNFSYRVTASPRFQTPGYLSHSLQWPVACNTYTSSTYGPFNSPWGNASGNPNLTPFFPDHRNWLHNGIDIACAPSTQVVAACSGVIKKKGNLGSDTINDVDYQWGWYAVQECQVNDSFVTIAYDHLNSNSIPAEGENVGAGQPIGTIYNLSYPGEQDHLHFGICTGSYNTCGTTPQNGAMPDTSFSGLMINPDNGNLYEE
jgi:murein DD-endopeptidase MepM/ murein hydrolase activator NlpD